MKNLLTTLKKAFLVLALMIVTILVCTLANAGEDAGSSSLGERDFYSFGNLSNNLRENGSGATKFVIPLSRSLSLDLGLSSVGRGQSPSGEKQWDTPPILIPKAPGSDLHYGRLGVGLSFGF